MVPVSTPEPRDLFWLRLPPQRSVVAAHLRHVRGKFLAAGWRVEQGLLPPPPPEGVLAVMDDPWVEALPRVADYLSRADAGAAGRWRVPRINGASGPQGWSTDTGPYTALDYEQTALETPHRRGRGIPAGSEPWCGFSVAAPGEAGHLLEAGWPPEPSLIVLVPAARLYRYHDPAAHDRRELDPFIPPAAETLVDVGCGHGLLGSRHRRDGRRVIGIEPDWELAREAARRLDLVLPTTAEIGLETLRPGVDCLVFADVLEHISDPAGVLEKAARVLAPGGRIVTSLPNSAWAPVLRALAAGRWDPTVAGVQARDHLAPMTPASFRRMAAECGLRVIREVPVIAALPRRLRWWAWLMAKTCGGEPRDLLTTQWTAVLEK